MLDHGARLDKTEANQGGTDEEAEEEREAKMPSRVPLQLLGGPTKAARICGVSNAAVHHWIQSRKCSVSSDTPFGCRRLPVFRSSSSSNRRTMRAERANPTNRFREAWPPEMLGADCGRLK